MRPTLALVATLALVTLALPARGADAPKAPPAPEKPLLWVVEGPPRVYLFGTIHLPDDRVVTLPDVVRKAHAASDVVWGELSLEDLDSPSMAKAIFLEPGRSLGDVVGAEVMGRVKAYLDGRRTPVAIFQRMRPVWAAVTIGMLDALPLLATRTPMDKQLLRDAKDAGKATGGLETVEEQLAVFDRMPLEAQARYLDATVAELVKLEKEGKKPSDAVVEAYVSGDEARITKEMDAMSASDDPEAKALAQRLLGDRNRLMAERLVARVKARPDRTYFVAVGAAHLPGEGGVLDLLGKAGWKARRVAPGEEVPAGAPAPKEPVPAGK